MAEPDAVVESIDTPNLTGRRTCVDDFAELAAMGQDARVMATLGGVRSEEESREMLQKGIVHWERYGYGFWVFRDKTDNGLVGRAGLRHVDIDGNDEVEVAYALRAEYWGKGLATEMAKVSVEVAFERIGLKELVCFTLPTNTASRRVMEKAGFTYQRDIIHADLPHVFYRLRATDR